jgi:cell division protein FtsA
MKNKFRPKGSVIAALDIGTTKISCFIARMSDDEGGYDIVGVGHQASAGIKGGTVVDLEAAETAIRQTVHAAENMAAEVMKGYPLRDVVINVPGIHAQSHHFSADIDVLGHEVTEQDIRRALARAQDQSLSPDRDMVHTIAAGYVIDGHAGVRDPRGMFGQSMQVDIHLVTGDSGALRNIATCIERSHLDIAAMCVSPYAAGLSSLVEDEMDLGCTVIDMGGGVTSLAVFQAGKMIYADAIPVGGQHVTSDIARGLTTSIAQAERLKTLYGSAMGSTNDQNELIDVPQVGEDEHSSPNHVPRSLLIGIIQPRVEEIFELVRARLQDSGLGPSTGRRVVLTGGASQLPGLRDLGQMVLDKQVRLGKPIRLTGVPESVTGPAFATTAGLLTYITERSEEMPTQVTIQAEPENLMQRIRLWLRENW